ncbi:rhodanese-like domain-containing protein [Streptomyces sp. NPDC000983]|uniref:sulfurtransferase n=1 Tax=Streptomyces sp. NPDC000983 TaxID=3154373 RepID=UPI003324651A
MNLGTRTAHREGILIDAEALGRLLAAEGLPPGGRPRAAGPAAAGTATPVPLLVLDATVALASPSHDGDYRAAPGAGAWAEAHIPGSLHVDLLSAFTDPTAPYHFAHPSREAVRRELAALGADENTTVVLYDQGSLQWAARLWWVLRDAGVRARVLDGGLPAWSSAGRPVATGPAPERTVRPPLGDPFPRATADDPARPSLWIDKDGARAVGEGRVPGLLVCALSAAHFEGTTPTRYSRRGRIPGSVNLPAQDLLDTDGRLDVDAIRLPDRAEGPVVLYCGGGISASLAALGLTLTGVESLVVYDGSLEEWTADPALPLLAGPA